jgi:hypothetical protein
MMPKEEMIVNVASGKIKLPKSPEELLFIMDRFLKVSTTSFSSDELKEGIESFKDDFVAKHKTKSAGKKWCYISAIKDGMMGKKNKKLSYAVKVIHETDLTTLAIQQLIVENRIKLNGKKVYLVTQ